MFQIKIYWKLSTWLLCNDSLTQQYQQWHITSSIVVYSSWSFLSFFENRKKCLEEKTGIFSCRREEAIFGVLDDLLLEMPSFLSWNILGCTPVKKLPIFKKILSHTIQYGLNNVAAQNAIAFDLPYEVASNQVASV